MESLKKELEEQVQRLMVYSLAEVKDIRWGATKCQLPRQPAEGQERLPCSAEESVGEGRIIEGQAAKWNAEWEQEEEEEGRRKSKV